ncbi:hypothetical protein [Endozoicomonas sp. 8E]|nr:hypothetical protein [Endozoicomonas sp. 8E]WOG28788.1 hypothetical protein P6910_03780 [Endozoicomonas sp. 8E]
MSTKKISHTTSAGGSVFGDLGFTPEEVVMLQKLGRSLMLKVA